ncbi:hypothetical protein DAI21_22655 (plasmid) [Lelliottia sp. WB101]|nr:hypothetical protein DAI21_22655 [Lelliottia sp. WB101]
MNDIMTKKMTSPLEHITGLRLQPLVVVENGNVIGYEVLTSLKDLDPEVFFSSLTDELLVSYTFWQIAVIKANSVCLWMNLPFTVFLNTDLISAIISHCDGKKITFELQDTIKLLHLKLPQLHQVKTGIKRLREAGFEVWMDDVDESMLSFIYLNKIECDGIKIDKKVIRNKKLFNDFINEVLPIYRAVLVEGIETTDDFSILSKTEARMGQGFFWPEIVLEIDVPEEIYLRAYEFYIALLTRSHNKISIFIDSTNNFLINGMINASELVGRVDFCDNLDIQFVTYPLDADIVIFDDSTIKSHFSCNKMISNPYHRFNASNKRFIHIHDDSNYPTFTCPHVLSYAKVENKNLNIKEVIKNCIGSLLVQRSTHNKRRKAFCCNNCHLSKITLKENRVAMGLANGATISSLSCQMSCSIKTVSRYKRSVMRKLNVTSNISLLKYVRTYFN